MKPRKSYDRAYFDRWYHRGGGAHPGEDKNAGTAVSSRAERARKVHLAVATAQYYLGRPLRHVLDVGCGEAPWRAELKKLCPRADYLGLDSSEYAVNRFGRSRNIRPATIGQLAELRFGRDFDLIVCADVLHYVAAAELRRGLGGIVDMLAGVAFLEVFTRGDETVGDEDGFIPRPAGWYRRVFGEAGLIALGSHCYLSPRLADCTTALERPG